MGGGGRVVVNALKALYADRAGAERRQQAALHNVFEWIEYGKRKVAPMRDHDLVYHERTREMAVLGGERWGLSAIRPV